jgi:hypothetical protein
MSSLKWLRFGGFSLGLVFRVHLLCSLSLRVTWLLSLLASITELENRMWSMNFEEFFIIHSGTVLSSEQSSLKLLSYWQRGLLG